MVCSAGPYFNPGWMLYNDLQLVCNVNKTTCMILDPVDKTKIGSKSFLLFSVNGQHAQFVNEFRYLGHVLTNNLCDDTDVNT